MLTWAGEAGPGVQRDLAHQLWRAHFLEGADIADPLVLSTRAALVGLDLETAEALLASDEYARRGPHAGRDRPLPRHHAAAARRHRDEWTLAGVHSQNDYVAGAAADPRRVARGLRIGSVA